MQKILELSPKQIEYISQSGHRWNAKIGATQCGKTFIDVQYVIPQRIIERRGMPGLIIILGVTRETIERNVLEPMRAIWGQKMVTSINSRNMAGIFGERVYCLGDEKISQVSKIRGAKFKYVYIDEAVDMSEEVFSILASRMSLDYSCCDMTGNPSYPSHWLKKFIDSDADVYSQNWTLYDNPFLPQSYVTNLEKEYAGTVYFDRYILGHWTRAEGLIYPMYPSVFTEEDPSEAVGASGSTTEDTGGIGPVVSLDYGTENAFSALFWAQRPNGHWRLFREYVYNGRETGVLKTDAEYADALVGILQPMHLQDRVLTIVDPSAASFKEELRRRGVFKVRDADNDVENGIRETATAMQKGIFTIDPDCATTHEEIEGYVWDKTDTGEDKPVKENDHCMDAMRYFVKTMHIVRSYEKAIAQPDPNSVKRMQLLLSGRGV